MRKIIFTNDIFNKCDKSNIDLKCILIEDLTQLDVNKIYILSLIDHFNNRYKWNGMFDFKEVSERISNNHKLHILFYKNIEIGYVWIREVDNDKCFAYNLFVRKNIDRPDDAPKWLLSEVYDECLKKYKKNRNGNRRLELCCFKCSFIIG